VSAVEPEHVFELGFERIAPSSRHKAGVALRFPRMLRWRRDKPAREADTLETLRRMISNKDGSEF
jgi:DNA ligase-1